MATFSNPQATWNERYAVDEYLFGEDLLVAPVIEDGARTRRLVLPPGRWIDYDTFVAHQGPGPLSVDAPLARLPLFAREGAVLPLLPDDVDTLGSATDPSVVTRASRDNELWDR